MSLGSSLRQARLDSGYSIAQISAQTRIRPNVLTDMENDNFSSAGGVAYARGHIRTIAHMVGADADALVAEMEQTTGEFDRPMIDLLTENFATAPARERPRISYKVLSIVAGSVLGLLILVPAVYSMISSGSPAKTVGASSQSSLPAATSGKTSTDTPVVATKSSELSVKIKAINGSTWLGVTDSAGTQVFNGRISLGAEQSFTNNQLLRFVIGNAGAVTLNVNGQDLGVPGTVGEVVRLEFAPGASAQG